MKTQHKVEGLGEVGHKGKTQENTKKLHKRKAKNKNKDNPKPTKAIKGKYLVIGQLHVLDTIECRKKASKMGFLGPPMCYLSFGGAQTWEKPTTKNTTFSRICGEKSRQKGKCTAFPACTTHPLSVQHNANFGHLQASLFLGRGKRKSLFGDVWWGGGPELVVSSACMF